MSFLGQLSGGIDDHLHQRRGLLTGRVESEVVCAVLAVGHHGVKVADELFDDGGAELGVA